MWFPVSKLVRPRGVVAAGFPKNNPVCVVGGLGTVGAATALDVTLQRGEKFVGFRRV
jgi:hypothetical protein